MVKSWLLFLIIVLVFQPASATITNITANSDAWAQQGSPLGHGYQNFVAILGTGGMADYGYANFTLPVVSSVNSATLVLTSDFLGAGSIYIRRATSAWNESVVWTNKSSDTTTNQVLRAVGGIAPGTVVSTDVTDLVNDMLSQGNYGFAFIPYNAATDWDFRSRESANPPILSLDVPAPQLSIVSPASYVVITSGAPTQFSTSADQTITSYNWTVDGSDVTGTSTYTSAWIEGLHYVRVYGNNTYGNSNTLEWRVSVSRPLASAPVATANESRYTLLKNDTRNADAQALVQNSILPYTDILANVFWLFVWLMLTASYWIRQRSVGTPSVILLIFGGIAVSMIPEQYSIYAKAIIAIGITGTLYFLFTKKND